MRKTSYEERVSMWALSEAGSTDREIGQQLGWKASTVRKWRRRRQGEGEGGLVSKMGRPVCGGLQGFGTGVVETLAELRRRHPGWGAKTLHSRLAQEESLQGMRLPSRASIARWLKGQGLTRRYERHQALPQASPPTAKAAHEEWEMDARGYEKVAGVGVVNLLNLNDRFSKVKLLSYPCWLGENRASRHPTTEDYQLVFRLTASEWGLPDRLYVDRDSVFYDNRSKSPFPTLFHLWLLALGVELVIGPPHQPTERGLTERSHQTWSQQVLVGQSFAGCQALEQALRQQRTFLNEQLPCATLANLPPLIACPQARIPRRLYRPEWEEELLELSRIYTYLAQGRWFRKASNIGAVSLGGQTYLLGQTWAKKEVVITFQLNNQQLLFHAPAGDLHQSLSIQGLAKTDLIGPLGPLVHCHGFQLALPFSWDHWQLLRLSETLAA